MEDNLRKRKGYYLGGGGDKLFSIRHVAAQKKGGGEDHRVRPEARPPVEQLRPGYHFVDVIQT